jgi:ATP-dependent DNA helicase DinG
LIAGDAEADGALQQILHAARALPGDAWSQRVNGGNTDGATERFLALVRQQVYARAQDADGPYGLETETIPPCPTC